MRIVRNYINANGEIIIKDSWCFRPANSKYSKHWIHPNETDRSGYDTMFRGVINY